MRKCTEMPPKTKTFGGKRYSISGTGTSQITKKKSTINRWAKFQRTVNKRNVRIVKVKGGYAGYMR